MEISSSVPLNLSEYLLSYSFTRKPLQQGPITKNYSHLLTNFRIPPFWTYLSYIRHYSWLQLFFKLRESIKQNKRAMYMCLLTPRNYNYFNIINIFLIFTFSVTKYFAIETFCTGPIISIRSLKLLSKQQCSNAQGF